MTLPGWHLISKLSWLSRSLRCPSPRAFQEWTSLIGNESNRWGCLREDLCRKPPAGLCSARNCALCKHHTWRVTPNSAASFRWLRFISGVLVLCLVTIKHPCGTISVSVPHAFPSRHTFLDFPCSASSEDFQSIKWPVLTAVFHACLFSATCLITKWQ